MTCAHNCKNCIYGTLIPIKGYCTVYHRITCAGDCNNCRLYWVEKFKVICKADPFHRKEYVISSSD